MFEIVFLGTSASAPSIHRGLSGQIVICRDHRFLIDCGEGTQRQILKSGLGFRRLEHILITHGHLDHILGLAGLLSTFVRWEAFERLGIYGSPRALARVRDLIYGIVLGPAADRYPLNIVETWPGSIMETKYFALSAFKVLHRGAQCLGYAFEEPEHRPFLAEKAEALGVPFGPERSQLVRGESITLEGGRVIEPSDVLADAIPGAKLVHVGDAGDTGTLIEPARGATCLVIEATYLHRDVEIARQFGHLTARDAAELAIKAEVDTLILTHISRRYFERDVLAEARGIFPDSYVARDFDRFQITREGVRKVEDAPREEDDLEISE
ncbi:ribonuclease Z [Candidatus Peregrinibacteria bacterium]|jgi:ribonuclease Z|nr:ribonuclease Z [Candidatus Peregrinibacteria bacterium]